MKTFILVLAILVLGVILLVYSVIFGIPQGKTEQNNIISSGNKINGEEFDFCEKEVRYPRYYVGHDITRDSPTIDHYYYLKNKKSLNRIQLNFISKDNDVFYAKYHEKIQKWVVFSEKREGVVDRLDSNSATFYKFVFSNSKDAKEKELTCYYLANSMHMVFDVDPIANTLKYIDKKGIEVTVEIE